MKRFNLALGLFSTISVGFIVPTLTSCNNQTDTRITITFVAGENGTLHGGLTPKYEPGIKFKDVIAPATNPNKNYKFDNWYLNDQVIDKDFIINEPITVVAKFVPIQ